MQLRTPDLIRVFLSGKTLSFTTPAVAEDACISLSPRDGGLSVSVTSETLPLCYVSLRWRFQDAEMRREPVRILGDAWERGYGDLSFRGIEPDRIMPWYMAVSNGSDSVRDMRGRYTECFGVKTRPAAMCAWQYDAEGVTLWLDLRCGGSGVLAGGRMIEAATVLMADYRDISAFDALSDFCHRMSPDPLPLPHKVYGSNNWYYAYGKSSHEEILGDCRFVKDLTADCEEIPYMVIDDGWQENPIDAPWDKGGEKFPDMQRLASEMRQIGVRPGIWVRYLINGRRPEFPYRVDVPEEWRLSRDSHVLDPSHPGVLDYVKKTTRRLATEWGYELIKHDFSTYDIFGRWGNQTKDFLAGNGWHFYDRTRTSAEIVVDFYRAIYEAADGALILGCNAISHLCAGLCHLNRTGDDTSGLEWERTRRMGINTLAFRMPQHGAFYAADADCLGILGRRIPWEYNRKWMELLSQSGTPLFVSCEVSVPNDAEKEELRTAFAAGARQDDRLIPLDWMENNSPCHYLLNGKEWKLDLLLPEGTDAFTPVCE